MYENTKAEISPLVTADDGREVVPVAIKFPALVVSVNTKLFVVFTCGGPKA